MEVREYLELEQHLKNATNEELDELFKKAHLVSPFRHPDTRLNLPSVNRAIALKTIEHLFRTGQLTAKKA